MCSPSQAAAPPTPALSRSGFCVFLPGGVKHCYNCEKYLSRGQVPLLTGTFSFAQHEIPGEVPISLWSIVHKSIFRLSSLLPDWIQNAKERPL